MENKKKKKLSRTGWRVNSGVTLFAVAGIIVLIGILSVRHPASFDFSVKKVFTLDERTLNVLERFEKPLSLKAFFTQNNPQLQEFKKRLELYKRANKNLSVEIIDPNRNPAKAEKYHISFNGESIVEYEGRSERFRGISEERITNALHKLSRTEKRVLYVMIGHGEKTFEENGEKGERGISAFGTFLKREGYQLKELRLFEEKKIPEDASALLLLGAVSSLYPDEVRSLREYLGQGGSLFITTEPEHTDAGLVKLLSEGGIELENDIIVDRASAQYGGDIFSPIVSIFARHAITKEFNASLQFAFARSVKRRLKQPKGAEVTELCITNNEAWGETDMQRLQEKSEVAFDDKDVQPPLSLAVAALYDAQNNPFMKAASSGGEGKKARMVVLGDTDIITNILVGAGGNLNFLLNSINWLAEDEQSIRFDKNSEEEAEIVLIRKGEAMPLLFFSVFFIPVILVAFGVRIYQRRKYQA